MPKAFPQTKRRNAPWTPLQRRTWLAERRRRSRCLMPAPVLVAAYPDLAVWTWDYPDPAYWYAYHQHAEGDPFTYDDRGAGTDRQYAPDGGQYPMFIVGCDANGNEVTQRSNVVRPEDAQPPVLLNAPDLVLLGKVLSECTWRAVAPVVVDDWQFCTTDTPFDPQVKSFDQWVQDADSPDTAFVIVDTTTATVTVDFTFCAARYRVGATWSSWTGVVTNLGYGLVAHFAFDEVSGDRSDNVGGYALRGFDCTINSAPGLFVRGALFNRSGFLQGIDETTLFSPSPSGLTVSIWVNLDGIYDTGSDVRFVSLWNDSGWPANSSWAIWSGTPEEANITAMVMGTGYTYLQGEANFSGWNHICLVYEPVQSIWTLYFNGAAVSSANFGYAPVSGKLGVGANANCQDATPQGVFDELAIWSRPLSPAEIDLLYNDGTGRAYPY